MRRLEQNSPWNVEDLLRLAVDMKTILKGNHSEDVALAHEALAEYLMESGDLDNEAPYWKEQAA